MKKTTPPAVGKLPSTAGIYTETEGVIIDFRGTEWMEMKEDGNLKFKDPTTVFEAGKEYWICIGVDPAPDYVYAEEASVSVNVNGKKASKIEFTHGTWGFFYLQFPVLEGIKMIEATAEWVQDSGKDAVFVSNADFADFDRVEIDGKTLDPSHYTAEEGSTKVTIKASFLKTLSPGTHKVSIVSTTGVATAAVQIKAPAKPTEASETKSSLPATGESDTIPSWAACLLLSLGALLVAVRRKKTNK